jgi:hypothetical protein
VPDAFRALIGLSLEETARHLLLPGVGLLLPLLNTGTGEAHSCMNVLQGGKVEPAPAKPEAGKGAARILDRVGGAVRKGAGDLLKFPGRILGSE